MSQGEKVSSGGFLVGSCTENPEMTGASTTNRGAKQKPEKGAGAIEHGSQGWELT